MLADHPQKEFQPRIRLLIACSVGLLIAILATIRICLPALGLFAQFLLLSPLIRAAIIVQLLSPGISFLLASGWVWILLVLGEQLLSRPGKREKSRQMALTENQLLHWPHNQQKRAVEQADPLLESAHTGWKADKRPLAIPPLFQLDPTNPWHHTQLPVTPPPMTNLAWSPSAEPSAANHESTEEQSEEAETEAEREPSAQKSTRESAPAHVSMTQAEHTPPRGVDVPSPQQEANEIPTAAHTSGKNFSFPRPGARPDTQTPVTMTLLKEMKAWIQADDGTTLEIKLRGGENAIRLIQLAYIAWRQGEPVDRDKILTMLSRGKRRDMTVEQLGEVFDAAKRYLRQDLDRAVNELKNNGHPVSEDIDFFSNEPGFYWLHPSCHVIDLEKIEEYYHPIQLANKQGLLNESKDGSIPDWVAQACQKLIEAYPGDFLQSLLERFPEEFGGWVREPVTIYRDRYLDATLILANYESALGKNAFEKNLSVEQQRRHIGRAAQLFYDYAMYSLNSRWDQKLKFAYRTGKDGERVVRAARAIRRCVVELGKLGSPDMIDQMYLAFKERMEKVSEGNWKPDQATETDVTEAKRTTSAYRFSSQMFQDENSNRPK